MNVVWAVEVCDNVSARSLVLKFAASKPGATMAATVIVICPEGRDTTTEEEPGEEKGPGEEVE